MTFPQTPPESEIVAGYHPGVIGRIVAMHAAFYSQNAGFGQFFESKVAAGLAEFTGRLTYPRNCLWTALHAGAIIGSIAVNAEDLGPGIAHLRWFIVDPTRHGGGLGKRLLLTALAFCDANGFAETHLWTFRGLEAARRLYEANGFHLAEEFAGTQWGSEVIEQRFIRPKQPSSM